MNNTKYEIDFIEVGDTSGDAIALRYKINDYDKDYTVMVIDGGSKETGENLVNHIRKYYGTEHVNYVINTHPDSDHSSGLTVVLEKLEVDRLYMHRPWEHINEILNKAILKDKRVTEYSLKNRFKTTYYKFAYQLEEIAKNRKIQIIEPFSGTEIGIFKVLSPSKEFYLDLIINSDKTYELEGKYNDNKYINDSRVNLFHNIKEKIKEYFNIDNLEKDPQTSNENNTSVIMHGIIDNKGILFTGDAGVIALNEAYKFNKNIKDTLYFIQVPHHGSKHNVNSDVLNKIVGNIISINEPKTKTAYVSAGKNDEKHPRKCVTNAFYRRGCKIYTNKNGNICQFHNTPLRDGWYSPKELDFFDEYYEE